MCGIAALFDTRGTRPIDRSLLDRMNQAQFHRGPTRAHLHRAGIGLAHRGCRSSTSPRAASRCSTRPLDLHRLQRRDLQLPAGSRRTAGAGLRLPDPFRHRGHRAAWAAWGEECVRKLRGMFAFAIWDTRQEKLFIARDASASSRCISPHSMTDSSSSAPN